MSAFPEIELLSQVTVKTKELMVRNVKEIYVIKWLSLHCKSCSYFYVNLFIMEKFSFWSIGTVL